jgi:hypothetical protein
MRVRFLLLFTLISAALAQSPDSLLPKAFSGWQKSASKTSTNASAIDAASAAALKEYSFKDSEEATYTRDGRKITLRALRFQDGTGGFGAFTYYRERGMAREELCDNAASAREHIVLHCADIVIDAHWDRVTAMTMAELRTLAQALPKLSGPASQPPAIPPSLHNIDDLKLALGPASHAHFTELPGWGELTPAANLIDYQRSAEVIIAPILSGRGIMTVVRYPTNRIAMQELPKLDAWSKQLPADSGERNLQSQAKRSGPILVTVRGQLGTDEVVTAINAVNYEADVTWNEATGLEKRNNIGGLVYAAILLAIIIFGFAVIGGLVFGGFRILLRKIFPNRFADPTEDREFIRLNIE